MRLVLSLTVLFGLTTASTARAQTFTASGDIEPAITDCAYTFASGSGASAFIWCLTENGNIVRFETPAGQDHAADAATLGEGYAVCSASGVHGVDFGNFAPTPFGPATVLAGCTSGSSCTIQRDTTDGAFRLVQKFTQNKKETELNIDHTLTNIGAVARTDVVLTRLTHLYMNDDLGDDFGDTSARSAWLRDIDGVTSTASTVKESASTFIVTGLQNDCNPIGVVPSPTGPGDLGTLVIYDLGTLTPGKKKVVRVQIRRQ